VDGRAILLVGCTVAGGAWALLVLGVVAARLRPGRLAAAEALPAIGGWQPPKDPAERPAPAPADEPDARRVLEQGLRSADQDVRVASIAALGRLGDRHEWAIDYLIEGLTNGVENPVRVATQLDKLAPRPGSRLVPLLDHPAEGVRFYATRLLARYGDLARNHVPDLTRDFSPYVRAAALETLRAVSSPEALRCSLELLDDPSPRVRAHAGLTASRIAGQTSAPFLAPLLGDESWWVREAARKALATAGPGVAAVVAPLLEHGDPTVRKGAALVLQDVGAVDELVSRGGEVERTARAGGVRLLDSARRRSSAGGPLIPSPAPGGLR
jgi:HEAT repeat protein